MSSVWAVVVLGAGVLEPQTPLEVVALLARIAPKCSRLHPALPIATPLVQAVPGLATPTEAQEAILLLLSALRPSLLLVAAAGLGAFLRAQAFAEEWEALPQVATSTAQVLVVVRLLAKLVELVGLPCLGAALLHLKAARELPEHLVVVALVLFLVERQALEVLEVLVSSAFGSTHNG